jgi:hypothetical protein
MPRGGRRPSAGRKPGQRNKKTVTLLAELEASGETPLEYMVRVYRSKPLRLGRQVVVCRRQRVSAPELEAQVNNTRRDVHLWPRSGHSLWGYASSCATNPSLARLHTVGLDDLNR